MGEAKLPQEIKLPAGEEVILRFGREFSAFLIPYIMGLVTTFVIIIIIMTITNTIMFILSGATILNLIYLIPINFIGLFITNFYYIILGIAGGLVLIPIIGYFYTKSHIYLVTSKRFIIFKKFIIIKIRETKLTKITDLTVKQGLWGRVFNFGDINPITPGLQMKLPRQSGPSSMSAAQSAQTITFPGFAGSKYPFLIVHQFKSIERFGTLPE